MEEKELRCPTCKAVIDAVFSFDRLEMLAEQNLDVGTKLKYGETWLQITSKTPVPLYGFRYKLRIVDE